MKHILSKGICTLYNKVQNFINNTKFEFYMPNLQQKLFKIFQTRPSFFLR